jgi:hypothetical protein
MSGGGVIDRVADGERIARFVRRKSHLRFDGTVKHDAWMPPSDFELSVTRHISLGENGIWERGRAVVAVAGGELVGRADISASDLRTAGFPEMDVVPAPLTENPQHAHIIGWQPGQKPRWMAIAKRLAAASAFVPAPSAE